MNYAKAIRDNPQALEYWGTLSIAERKIFWKILELIGEAPQK